MGEPGRNTKSSGAVWARAAGAVRVSAARTARARRETAALRRGGAAVRTAPVTGVRRMPVADGRPAPRWVKVSRTPVPVMSGPFLPRPPPLATPGGRTREANHVPVTGPLPGPPVGDSYPHELVRTRRHAPARHREAADVPRPGPPAAHGRDAGRAPRGGRGGARGLRGRPRRAALQPHGHRARRLRRHAARLRLR